MKIELNQDSLGCQGCDACIAGPSLGNCNCLGSEATYYPEPYEVRNNVEQIRLLMSRDAVLRDFNWAEAGDSQW